MTRSPAIKSSAKAESWKFLSLLGRRIRIRKKFAKISLAVQLLGELFKKSNRQLIIAPAPEGSFGDLLVLEGLQSILGNDTLIAAQRYRDKWNGSTSLLGTLILDWHDKGRIKSGVARLLSGRWDSFFYIATDTLDGHYNFRPRRILDFLDFVSRRGKKVFIIGFSFSLNSSPQMVSRISEIDTKVKFIARGEVSANRFSVATSRPCMSSIDISWAKLAAKTEEFSFIRGGSLRVGFNLSIQVLSRFREEAEWLGTLSNVLNYLSSRGIEIVPIPHDFRGRESDEALLRKLWQEAGIPYERKFESSMDLQKFLSTCDAVVSCRMHLAIRSLSMAVPTLLVDYADKSVDLESDEVFSGIFSTINGDSLISGDWMQTLDEVILIKSRGSRLALSEKIRNHMGGRIEDLSTILSN